ncbi:aryl-alcohol dehydrogenase-like predicted oxidoreductase [Flavobacterium sp. CG_23.5]|uniref:aldo/keto reductase n=1 Tax=unclassified Flavobacterium TaxID=196869 RepID=UPI0018CADE10|nr:MULTISPECIES: aldo/keto reductase [unclassified Flavobacterium]MBG6110880.1 aryl-alcohol dehydrogenase-like predicted oxidoreductase [Flavobacterium sp. CG_9.10]MBP2283778.1 aryl-alcohol dehydrogenase-like predicted oxidoreductase [Flavobacterium sp. CG_23.5]
MKYTTLPNTAIKVSKICLGTMTFGQQNSEAEGHAQMDYAFENGINFFDTAEMYSVPARQETYGSTEKILGTWFKKSGKREEIVLASKIAGPNPNFTYMREKNDFSPASIKFALDQSLQRLQTDYIDLYQLHWPERKTNFFGQRGFKVQDDAWEDNIHNVLETLDGFVKEGKINHIGLSNETPWGIMRFLEESKYNNLPRIKTVQNPYSLLNRLFENGSAEACLRENVGLLAYSPMAFGVLSGKFLTGESHPDARIKLFPQFSRYNSEQCTEATRLYQEIAKKNGLTLTQLSLAFIEQQQFVTSTIIGATTMEQLIENIDTTTVSLSEEILKAIDEVQAIIPDPAP